MIEHRPARTPAWAIAALLVPCACEPWHTPSDEDDAVRPALFAVPDDLSFHVSVNEEGEGTQSFQLVNRLEHTVLVWGYTDVDGDPVFAAGEGMTMLTELPAGGVLEVPVRFAPTGDASYGGAIRVQTDAPEVPEVEISLAGRGLAPWLFADVDGQPELPVGCTGAAELVIGNLGGADLHVLDVADDDLGDFALLAPVPSRIGPGQQASVPVAFRPSEEGLRIGSIALSTDDPARPSVQLPLEGTGLAPDRQVETFHYGTGGGVDLVLAMEPATGGAWVGPFAAGLGELLDALDARGVDWRVTALSLETGCPLAPDAWGSPADERGAVVEQLRSALLDGPDVPNHALLAAVRHAAEETGPNGCLSAFRRSGRPLHAIVVAEHDDASPDGWDAEVQRAQAALDGPLALSAVVPGEACDASAPSYEAAVATTGGAALDLCTDAWDDHQAALARTTAAFEPGEVAFELAGEPLPGTLHVLVDGEAWTAYTVDAANRRITLTAAPEDGAEVRVSYASADICP